MSESYKLITEILPSDERWTAKVVVIEKTSTRTSDSKKKFQNLIFVDLNGNQVHATIYDNNIAAFQDLLSVGKTYLISNAIVRSTKPEFRAAFGDIQWTITGKTRAQEVNELNSGILISKYQFTPFDMFEKFMDSNIDIDIIAAVIDIKPKIFIRTKKGAECFVQDLVLINERFQTIFMTMWDVFLEKECIYIHTNIARKPTLIGKHIRVSSYNGLSISSKANSCFIFEGPFDEYVSLKTWVGENNAKLSMIASEQSFTHLSPSKSAIPDADKITMIKDIQRLLAVQSFFWVKSTALITTSSASLWYMSCQNCHKISSADFGDTYFCIYCLCPHARALPRARAVVTLRDATGTLQASIIGETAELFLQFSADRLRQCSDSNELQQIRMSIDEDHMFYIKSAPKTQDSDEYSYEVVLIMEVNENFEPTKTDEIIHRPGQANQLEVPPNRISPLSDQLNIVKSTLQVKRAIFEETPFSYTENRTNARTNPDDGATPSHDTSTKTADKNGQSQDFDETAGKSDNV